MKKREPVSHIMTKNVKSVNVTNSLKDVVALVKKEKVRHVPVLEGEDVVGIISSTDLNRLTFSNLFENQESADEAVLEMLKIEQVMSAKPLTVNADDSIREVAEIFANAHFHALPVVENQKLVGIVSTTDIIKYMLEQY